jgi:hypothetical protein
LAENDGAVNGQRKTRFMSGLFVVGRWVRLLLQYQVVKIMCGSWQWYGKKWVKIGDRARILQTKNPGDINRGFV